jgi:hypothetical protein
LMAGLAIRFGPHAEESLVKGIGAANYAGGDCDVNVASPSLARAIAV